MKTFQQFLVEVDGVFSSDFDKAEAMIGDSVSIQSLESIIHYFASIGRVDFSSDPEHLAQEVAHWQQNKNITPNDIVAVLTKIKENGEFAAEVKKLMGYIRRNWDAQDREQDSD